MVMEACTACSEMILRKDHATHYCPMRPIPCPFHVFGCTLSEKVRYPNTNNTIIKKSNRVMHLQKLPSEIEQHSKENMEYHLSLMCRVVSQLLEEQKKLDEIVKSLQRENAELKQQIAKLSEVSIVSIRRYGYFYSHNSSPRPKRNELQFPLLNLHLLTKLRCKNELTS